MIFFIKGISFTSLIYGPTDRHAVFFIALLFISPRVSENALLLMSVINHASERVKIFSR